MAGEKHGPAVVTICLDMENLKSQAFEQTLIQGRGRSGGMTTCIRSGKPENSRFRVDIDIGRRLSGGMMTICVVTNRSSADSA
jgi:hypothetical protein